MASYFAVQARIADEVQKNLNIAAWLRECLENEMNEAVGTAGRKGVDPKTILKWRDVVKAMEALTVCKIKLDTSAKKMAENMSPEEELEAVRSYVRSLEASIAYQFLKAEMEWRDSRK